MPPRLVYVSASTLPSAEANAVHVAQMCDAFASLGCTVSLRAARGGAGSVARHYDLHQPFAIRFEGRLRHRAWLLGHEFGRWLPRQQTTMYFGRRPLSLARLARAGYPTGLELHHPPRSAKQAAAVAGIVTAPRFLGLVVISEQLRGELLSRLPQLDPQRVLVAHDGVRADRIRTPQLRTGGAVRAVYCGSFHPGKGVETILAAAARVPEVQFDLIGGEPGQIEAMRQQAPANLRLLGHQPHDETQRRLGDYDIALAPYGTVVRGAKTPAHESLAAWMSPLKIFEYMAAGLPMVTSDLTVLREILVPGQSALMPPPDDPVALAHAVRALAADPALRLRLAKAAQQQLQTFTWENRAASILAFLHAGLQRHTTRR